MGSILTVIYFAGMKQFVHLSNTNYSWWLIFVAPFMILIIVLEQSLLSLYLLNIDLNYYYGSCNGDDIVGQLSLTMKVFIVVCPC